MNIQETKAFLLRCIKSCDTYEQADLMIEMIYWAVIERYQKDTEMELVKKELMDSLTDQKMKIVWASNKPEIIAPTLSLYDVF